MQVNSATSMPHALHSVSLRRAAAAGTAARPLAPRVPVLHRNRFAPARSGSQEDVPASSDAQRVTDASSANAGEGPSTSYGGCLLDSLDSHVPYSFVAGLAAVGFAETVYLTAVRWAAVWQWAWNAGTSAHINAALAAMHGISRLASAVAMPAQLHCFASRQLWLTYRCLPQQCAQRCN